jgi:hypothetical protein
VQRPPSIKLHYKNCFPSGGGGSTTAFYGWVQNWSIYIIICVQYFIYIRHHSLPDRGAWFLWDQTERLFTLYSFCWAELNHRTLLSAPPPKLETIVSARETLPACERSNLPACALFTATANWQQSTFHTLFSAILQFSSFAQPQSKCLLLFNITEVAAVVVILLATSFHKLVWSPCLIATNPNRFPKRLSAFQIFLWPRGRKLWRFRPNKYLWRIVGTIGLRQSEGKWKMSTLSDKMRSKYFVKRKCVKCQKVNFANVHKKSMCLILSIKVCIFLLLSELNQRTHSSPPPKFYKSKFTMTIYYYNFTSLILQV